MHFDLDPGLPEPTTPERQYSESPGTGPVLGSKKRPGLGNGVQGLRDQCSGRESAPGKRSDEGWCQLMAPASSGIPVKSNDDSFPDILPQYNDSPGITVIISHLTNRSHHTFPGHNVDNDPTWSVLEEMIHDPGYRQTHPRVLFEDPLTLGLSQPQLRNS